MEQDVQKYVAMVKVQTVNGELEVSAEQVPGAHHPRGMSQWPAVLACGCFEGKNESADTVKGTQVHGVLAGLLEGLKLRGELPEWDQEGFHEQGALRASRWIRDRMAADGVPFDRLFVEHRCVMRSGVFGTADVVWVNLKTASVTICDFKTFYNPGRDYMAQLLGYGLAVAERLPWEVATVNCHVLYGDNPKVVSCSFDLTEAMEAYHEAMMAFDTRERGCGEPRQCGWCDLCNHQASCPAVRDVVKKSVDVGLAKLTRWDALAVEQKAQLLVLAENANKFVEAVRKAAKADLEAGLYESIEDAEHGIKYGLQRKSGVKRPRTVDAYRMLIGRGVAVDAVKARFELSAKSVKELLKEAGIKGKAADALMDEVCDVGTGSVSMVRM